jgi:cytochrome c biogenesis protein CcdA
LEPHLTPLRIVTGVVVIYPAIQALRPVRLPFVVSLGLPGKPHQAEITRQEYLASTIAVMSISLGHLVCVGGTLLASPLIYAGAPGSPFVGGRTLFLFALRMSVPFLMVAFAFDKVLPRFNGALSTMRYSTTVAGAVMSVVGLLILSGNDSIFEQLVV